MEDLAERVEELLDSAEAPLKTVEIAERLGVSSREVDRTIWDRPERFAWQPGHRWTLASSKRRFEALASIADHEDARAVPLEPRTPVELYAVTLASGITLKVTRRALDTQSLFSVTSAGNEVHLVINSAHELFAWLPMPFDPSRPDSEYKRLIELLLQAWALYEGSLPPGGAKRSVEDTRLMLGRRVLELVAEGR